MRFRWDEQKDLTNFRKHGFGFALATEIFGDPFSVTIEDRLYGDELRYRTIGHLEDLMLVVVIHTLTEIEGEAEIRIISARKATPTERRLYETQP